MRINALSILSYLTLLAFSVAHSYRILGLFPIPIRSHYAFYEKLLLELAKRGHEVDILTHYPSGIELKGYNELSVAGSMKSLENNISIAQYEDKNILDLALEFADLGNQACGAVLQHNLINELKTPLKSYDLIIAEMFATDCLLPYAHIYNAPIVGISSIGIMPWADERLGNPDNPAYISNYFLPLRGKLTFGEKVQSTLMNIAAKAWYYVAITLFAEIKGRPIFGEIPSIEEIAKGTILLLANRHFSLDDPRPLVPGVIEIGGMHINPPKTIQPKKLLDFVEKSQDGVIYFSMGTLIDMKTFSQEILSKMFEIFASLKNNIVVKLPKDALGNIKPSANVYIADNLPQLDILCHPKTKLFITHGGLLSIQEAAYCGTPIIGIPFHPGQEVNVKNYVDKMAGIYVDYVQFDKVVFRETIDKILKNDSYKSSAMKLSNLFKDRPIQPLDAAVYWTEYALKHGGQHLRSLGADLIIFEYLLVDVVLVGIFFMLIIMFVMYMVLQFLQELFDRPPPPKYNQTETIEKKVGKKDE